MKLIRRSSRKVRTSAVVAVASAAIAGASAWFVRRQTRKAERENPPSGSFVHVDGARLHYLDRGEGPALVMLHGNGASVQELEASGLVAIASRKYRVIALDRPGFGYSTRPRGRVWSPRAQAELIHSALKRIGVERPVIFGHSWGAMVALAYALQYPEDTRAAVLASGYYYPSLRLDVLLAMPPAIPVIGAALRYTVDPIMGRMLWPLITRRIFRPAPITQGFKEYPKWMSLRPEQLRSAAAESALMIPSAFELRARYKDIQVPVVLVAGDGDLLVQTSAQSARVHDELAGSEFRSIRGAGHMAHHTNPNAVMDAIDAARVAGNGPLATHEMRFVEEQ